MTLVLHVLAYNNHCGQKYVGEKLCIDCCLLLLRSYWSKSYDVIVFTYWILGQQVLISNMSNMWAFCFSTHGIGFVASKCAPSVFVVRTQRVVFMCLLLESRSKVQQSFCLHYGRWHSKIKRKMSQHGCYICLSLSTRQTVASLLPLVWHAV